MEDGNSILDLKRSRYPCQKLDETERISEHLQVRNALHNFGEKRVSYELTKLANLRKKADYEPYKDLTPQDISNAINHMEKIFNHLKFD